MAFNKSIALDIARKAPGQTVKTLNALGHWQWMQNSPSSGLESRKVSMIIKTLMGEGEDFKAFGYTLSRVVGLAKNCCFGIDQVPYQGSFPPPIFEVDIEQWIELMENYQVDIPYDQLPRYAEICMKALVISSQDWTTFDFDDQLYMPALAGWSYPSYDTVFIDECQDLSPIQHLMLSRLQAKGARIIAVGDRHQAIYGFRGALVDSMDRLKIQFQMKELPLSISYRCDHEIIREARSYCPTIQARDGAGIGRVEFQDNEDPQLFTNQLVVCRNNAPLFRAILRHYRAKAPCRVLSNFLESFQGFIRGFKTQYTSDLQSKLDIWFAKERDSAERRGFRGKVEALRDKYETVSLFCKEFQKTEDILACVKRLGECQVGPTLSTIHKAKGLEAEKVYLLRPDLLPSKYAQSEEQKRQEGNLSYVAITRAKHELTYGAMLI
jgi:superfamily I DNA/RNA helicase